MTSMACEICDNTSGNRVFTAREMMFGTHDRFEYMECTQCGCLQMIDVPRDLSRFYPENYYSLSKELKVIDGALAARVKRARTMVLLRAPVIVVEALVNAKRVPSAFTWFAGLGLHASSAICDVGSGNGQSLAWMLRQGFSNLTGFDPHIKEDIDVGGRLVIRKLGVDDIAGRWDLIMLNHSFEHMAQPMMVLERLRGHLNENGSIVIRMPVSDSRAWRTYGTDWVELDAPRHLFVHTQRSMNILAQRTGLVVSRTFFDSYALQFWGSEQYRRDIPLNDPRSYAENVKTDLFTGAEIENFDRSADELNRLGDGDRAGFVLRAV
jgi:2-polyprenyl-3-methyl-5-hydroxy-6-metoxy-1,4-benzoquinol methylase